ncbi:nucleotide exchange factor GrpE [Paucilactobacillus nenjiangensis]|uniref:Protein GrpE n=1 Tax=Paucilactobacillus nenjiangensis TaxID=1296540 RepID=A0A5P1X548_9LACO|nr:nucleotide exchange factor GrpE [Paucilactobacillus nenjiangensis]QER67621.1 nucleotide exchange factor GrpE [Paucilactobacillus nenjiangensis]
MAKDEHKKADEAVEEVKEEQVETPEVDETTDAPEVKTEEVSEVDQLKAKLAAAEDSLLREQAEIQNMNNRFKKEQSNLLKYDGQSLAKAILPVMDNLKRALEIEVSDENGQQLKKGIQMVHDHLDEALTGNSVTEIESLGKKFDPTLHQAVQTVPAEDGQEADTVVQVLQAGYQLKDRVLRPAMVVVSQ